MANKSTTKIAELTVDVYETPGAGGGATGTTTGTLMLAHGAWVGGWIWEKFASYFADRGYKCYAPTWRGHYDSRPVADLGAVSVFDFVEDAMSVARAVTPDVVIGESMGGLIAQKVAEASPALRGLVLMNPVPPFMVPARLKVMKAQFKYLGDLLRRRPNMPNKEDYKALILNNVDEPEASDFYARICPDSGRAIMEMSLGKIKVDANKVKCPVYVIAGHLDVILPPKVHRKIALKYGADIAEYPSMSHHTFSETGWEKVAAELATWLSGKLSGGRGGSSGPDK